MSRWSPTVLPTGVSVLGSAIRGGAEGWEAGREERRRKRRDELAEAMNLAQMQEQGIERDPLAGRRNRDARAQRMQDERIPGVDPFEVPGAFPVSSTTSVADVPSRTVAATPSEAGRYRDLGDSGYRLDTMGTPTARAEATYQRRRRETELAAEMARAETDRLVAGIPEPAGHAGQAHVLARMAPGSLAGFWTHEDPAPPRDYETSAERLDRELKVEEARGRNDLRVAGVRAATVQQGKPMTLRDADYIISGYLATPTGETWTAGQRLDFSRKLVTGELTTADLDRMTNAPTTAPADTGSGDGFLRSLARGFGGAVSGAMRGGGLGGAAMGAARGVAAGPSGDVNLNRPAAPARGPAPATPKTAVSREDFDAVVADKGRAYATRHFTVSR